MKTGTPGTVLNRQQKMFSLAGSVKTSDTDFRTQNWTALFEAGGQKLRVLGLTIFSFLCAAASIPAGIEIARSYGLAEADGGVLAPIVFRLGLATFVWIAGLGFAAGMILYGFMYADRVWINGNPRLKTAGVAGATGIPKIQNQTQACTLLIKTLLPPGSSGYILLTPETRRVIVQKAGALSAGGLAVRAPWLSIRVATRRLPLILDMKGKMPDTEKLIKSLQGKACRSGEKT